MTWGPNKLRDFFKNYDESNPNHQAAADILQAAASGEMSDEAEWVKKFREKAAAPKSSGDRIPKQALDIVKKYEGFRAGPYICPAGVPTIGYGNTFYSSGKKVTMSDPPITKEDAETMLRTTIEKSFLPSLEKIPHWGEMSDGQKSALISFSYNLGAHFYGDMDNFGSITRDLRDKNWANVPATLLKYRNPGSSFEEGLRKRRTEEGALWKS